jgi:hypothetical protein
MINATDDKRKIYAHYAAHCSYLLGAATDPDSRAIQSEMAAEWLKLAEAVRRPSPSVETRKSPLAQNPRASTADGKAEDDQSR